MKVKALCNIIYGGKMYGAGEVFEVDKLLANTEPAEPEPADEHERYNDRDPEEREPEEERELSEETERDQRRGRNPRRGRGEVDERD